MEKIDPHNSKAKLEAWKTKKIKGISKKNIELLRNYISDMEKGLNVSGTVKGGRSPIKLLSLASRIKKIMELVETKFKIKDITKITKDNLHDLFLDMNSGKIVKSNKKPYMDVGDYVKRFKSFWSWYRKVNKKEGIEIKNISEELSVSKKQKPAFVYFTYEDLEKMIKIADYDTKAIMIFLYDTGMRSPTEMMNVRVSDFENDFKTLNIREETTKNKYGRKIRLMLSSEIIKQYVKDNNLKDNDLIFTINPATANKRLKKIGKEILGEKLTKGRNKGSNLGLYDFRHSAGCYWVLKYKSEMSLMYRFAWKGREMIDYYTELLGMKDLISEDDMLCGIDKTQLEKELHELKEEKKFQQIFNNFVMEVFSQSLTKEQNEKMYEDFQKYAQLEIL